MKSIFVFAGLQKSHKPRDNKADFAYVFGNGTKSASLVTFIKRSSKSMEVTVVVSDDFAERAELLEKLKSLEGDINVVQWNEIENAFQRINL